MISYAQNFEDVMLARVFKGQASGFYIDVGVFHPTADSVTKHFYDLGWSGINIEALPKQFELILQARPRDINIQAAASTQPGPLRFHSVRDTGLSTARSDYAEMHADAGFAVEALEVPTVSLASVCKEHAHGKIIDFMKIDVEGAEADVVNSADWQTYRPKVVVIEATIPGSPEPAFAEWEPTITNAAYSFCYFDGLNRWYVREEDAQLQSAFHAPPNFFDHYKLARIVELEDEVNRLRRDVRTLRSAPTGIGGALRATAKRLLRR